MVISRSMRSAAPTGRAAGARRSELRDDVVARQSPAGDARAMRGECGDAGLAREQRPQRVNGLGVLAKRDDPLAGMLRSNSRQRASAIDVGIGLARSRSSSATIAESCRRSASASVTQRDVFDSARPR